MFLFEANIVNIDQVDDFLQKYTKELRSIAGKQFFENKVKKWIVQNDNYALETEYKPEYPEWARKAVERGDKIHTFFPSQQLRDELSHIVDFIYSVEQYHDAEATTELSKEQKAIATKTLNSLVKLPSLAETKSFADKWFLYINKHASEDEDVAGIEEIYKFSNGYKIIRIKSFKALEREGKLANNCVAGGKYDSGIFRGTEWLISLRDETNKPHVTALIKIGEDKKEIKEIQGNANSEILPKYQEMMVEFFNKFQIVPSYMGNAKTRLIWSHKLHKFIKNVDELFYKNYNYKDGNGWAIIQGHDEYDTDGLELYYFKNGSKYLISSNIKLDPFIFYTLNQSKDIDIITLISEFLKFEPEATLGDALKKEGWAIENGKLVKNEKDRSHLTFNEGAFQLSFIQDPDGSDSYYGIKNYQFSITNNGKKIGKEGIVEKIYKDQTRYLKINFPGIDIDGDVEGYVNFINSVINKFKVHGMQFILGDLQNILFKVKVKGKEIAKPIWEGQVEKEHGGIGVYRKGQSWIMIASKEQKEIYFAGYTSDRASWKYNNGITKNNNKINEFVQYLNESSILTSEFYGFRQTIIEHLKQNGWTFLKDKFVETDSLNKSGVIFEKGNFRINHTTPMNNDGTLFNKYSLENKQSNNVLLEIFADIDNKFLGFETNKIEKTQSNYGTNESAFPEEMKESFFMIINAAKIKIGLFTCATMGYCFINNQYQKKDNIISSLMNGNNNTISFEDGWKVKFDDYSNKSAGSVLSRKLDIFRIKSMSDFELKLLPPDADYHGIVLKYNLKGDLISISNSTKKNRKEIWNHVTRISDSISDILNH